MAQNSQIQAKGVGKDSKRHDLDGTPGLSAGSSLQQGDVQQLEAGQQQVQDTQGAQAAGEPLPAQPDDAAVAAPDPMEFAKGKIGGELEVPTMELSRLNTGQWLPLIEKLARSNAASPLLRRAYVQMLTRLQNEPFSGSTAVVDKRELDRQVENGF